MSKSDKGSLFCKSVFGIKATTFHSLLQGERRISVLVGYLFFFMLHIFGIYWWNRKDDLFYPLFMIPPKAIPPFWHAIFVILVNGTAIPWLLLSLFPSLACTHAHSLIHLTTMVDGREDNLFDICLFLKSYSFVVDYLVVQSLKKSCMCDL